MRRGVTPLETVGLDRVVGRGGVKLRIGDSRNGVLWRIGVLERLSERR